MRQCLIQDYKHDVIFCRFIFAQAFSLGHLGNALKPSNGRRSKSSTSTALYLYKWRAKMQKSAPTLLFIPLFIPYIATVKIYIWRVTVHSSAIILLYFDWLYKPFFLPFPFIFPNFFSLLTFFSVLSLCSQFSPSVLRSSRHLLCTP